MWRTQPTHKQSDTEYLDRAIERIVRDEHLVGHAQAILAGASAREPLIAQSLWTPQDVRFHAEGPFLRDHLSLMLAVLFALAEERLHLIDIEEFRRGKGYEGEIDELEETLKEHAAFFEAFTLFHDVTKWVSTVFTSRHGSRGEALGFVTPRAHHFNEAYYVRAKQRDQYLELYQAFERTFTGASAQEVQMQFYLAYGIQVHYPHHARKSHASAYEDLLDRLSVAHGLSSRDRDLLDDLTAHHMEFTVEFNHVRPSAIQRYIHLATKRGYDADDFLDLMQGCLFLDTVCASERLAPHGYWFDVTPLLNCLTSEYDGDPTARARKEAVREEEEQHRRNRIFREVGLDGVALMDLLSASPGPEFGAMLRKIQACVLGKGEAPRFGARIDRELAARAGKFYERIFEKGE